MPSARILTLLALAACASCSSTPSGGEVGFARVFSGPIGVSYEAKNAVVRSEQEWRALWTAGGPGMVAPPVSVDWSKRMLIAVALGSRPSGGHSVAIDSVVLQGSHWIVHARESRPTPGSLQTTMVTAPFDCVELPRFEDRIVFTVE